MTVLPAGARTTARRRLPRRAALVVTLALLVPALPLGAAPATPVVAAAVRTLPLDLGETVQRLADGDRLVGVTWTAGDPVVEVRWRTATGWTAWEQPEQDGELAPEPGTRPGTEPVWRPTAADLVAVRVAGAADGLELVRVGDGDVRLGGLRLGLPVARAAADIGLLGRVNVRADWGADERMRRRGPAYAPVRAVVVHHTAGGNDYRPEDVPARLRADYAYHVRSRGWSDLGYNAVVDRFGRIWEGRAGGIGDGVVGTHAAGFNTGTFGVSVMGDYTRTTATPEVVDALARVAAFAGQRFGFDPRGTVRMTSGGSPRYAAGRSVELPRVSGHTDTGRTACPGSLQDLLPLVRERAALLVAGAPALAALTVSGTPVHAPEPLVVDARLSRAAAWSLRVEDAAGARLGLAEGSSDAPLLVWRGLRPATPGLPVPVPVLPGTYRWVLEWGDGANPPQRREGPVEVGFPVVR